MDTDSSVGMTGGEGGWGRRWRKETWLEVVNTPYSVQMMCCTPETRVMITTSVTPVDSIKKKIFLIVGII